MKPLFLSIFITGALCTSAGGPTMTTGPLMKSPDAPERASVLAQEPFSALGAPAAKIDAIEGNTTLITEPKGELYGRYNRSAIGLAPTWGSIMHYVDGGIACDLYLDGDDVYMKNPCTQFYTRTYIKGKLTDDGITFQFPQCVYTDMRGGEETYYYANRMIPTEFVGGLTYEVEENVPNEITFHYVNGRYQTDPVEDGDVILGISDADGNWMAFGDYNTVLQPFKYPIEEFPENARIEEWMMTYGNDGHKIQVAFDGEDIYIQGFYSDCIEQKPAKGTFKDNVITIPSAQYIGIDRTNEYRLFVTGATQETQWDPEQQKEVKYLSPKDYITFKYDPATSTFTSNEIVCCYGGREMTPLDAYTNMIVRPMPSEISLQPANPVIHDVLDFNAEWGYAGVMVVPSIFNKDGYLMDTKNIYYRLFINDEPYVLSPEDYPELRAPMEWIPYSYSNYDIEKDGAYRLFYFFTDKPRTYKVQQKYVANGVEYLSDIVSYEGNGIEDSTITKEIRSCYYLDLCGRETVNPTAGIYVKVTEYTDGTRTVVKTVVK